MFGANIRIVDAMEMPANALNLCALPLAGVKNKKKRHTIAMSLYMGRLSFAGAGI